MDEVKAAQQAAEKRLSDCMEAMWEVQQGEEDPHVPDQAGPFCGCDTCIVREVLDAAWPHLLAAAREEYLEELKAHDEAIAEDRHWERAR